VAQVLGTPNPKQLQICKSQCRSMKQQGNSSPLKANFTTKGLNIEEKELSTIEFQNNNRMIPRRDEEASVRIERGHE
jgi:hypothetical protein